MALIKKKLLSLLIISLLFTNCFVFSPRQSSAASPIIVLSNYQKTLKIGDTFSLKAITSNLSIPKFSSSSSSIASVDGYGLVTGKKAGACTINVRSGSSQACCKITVQKTIISVNKTSISLQNGKTFQLNVSTSNHSIPTFKSNRQSIATVSTKGLITAIKPGTATITVSANQTSCQVNVTVLKPTISLSKNTMTSYRNKTFRLTATVSSGRKVTWSSSKKTIAFIDENGLVTCFKHGVTILTAKVDGVSKSCILTVQSPSIALSASSLRLKVGNSKQITAKVSSGNTPSWTSSNTAVASVTSGGKITAKKKGTAQIKVKEDGTTAICSVTVV